MLELSFSPSQIQFLNSLRIWSLETKTFTVLYRSLLGSIIVRKYLSSMLFLLMASVRDSVIGDKNKPWFDGHMLLLTHFRSFVPSPLFNYLNAPRPRWRKGWGERDYNHAWSMFFFRNNEKLLSLPPEFFNALVFLLFFVITHHLPHQHHRHLRTFGLVIT